MDDLDFGPPSMIPLDHVSEHLETSSDCHMITDLGDSCHLMTRYFQIISVVKMLIVLLWLQNAAQTNLLIDTSQGHTHEKIKS